jgi:5-methyltetrahydrofolate--homocysteine methyltransferase
VLEGDAERTADLVREALENGLAPKEVLDGGLVAGMSEVGVRFREGDMFIPEVLMSADAMQAGLRVLRPSLAAAGARLLGKIVLGPPCRATCTISARTWWA